jgi:hypothetical protein
MNRLRFDFGYLLIDNLETHGEQHLLIPFLRDNIERNRNFLFEIQNISAIFGEAGNNFPFAFAQFQSLTVLCKFYRGSNRYRIRLVSYHGIQIFCNKPLEAFAVAGACVCRIRNKNKNATGEKQQCDTTNCLFLILDDISP